MGGRGHPKPNPNSDLQFLLDFLCKIPITQLVEKLYIGVVEGSISQFKSQCTIGVRWARARVMYLAPVLRGQAVSVRVKMLIFCCLTFILVEYGQRPYVRAV